MRHDDRKDWRRGIEDGGKAAGNLCLSPKQETERNTVVQQPYAEELDPYAAGRGNGLPCCAQVGEQRHGGDCDAGENNNQRRQFGKSDLGEEERSAPQHGENKKKSLVEKAHALSFSHYLASPLMPCGITS